MCATPSLQFGFRFASSCLLAHRPSLAGTLFFYCLCRPLLPFGYSATLRKPPSRPGERLPSTPRYVVRLFPPFNGKFSYTHTTAPALVGKLLASARAVARRTILVRAVSAVALFSTYFRKLILKRFQTIFVEKWWIVSKKFYLCLKSTKTLQLWNAKKKRENGFLLLSIY